jgi:hypothetical protein
MEERKESANKKQPYIMLHVEYPMMKWKEREESLKLLH